MDEWMACSKDKFGSAPRCCELRRIGAWYLVVGRDVD